MSGDQSKSQNMEFFKFDDCLIANVSLQEYYSKHGPTVAILFMDDLAEMPSVGFSIMPGHTIAERNLRIAPLVFHTSWNDWQKHEPIDWANRPVKKYDVLRIFLRMTETTVSVRYRLNCEPTTGQRLFRFPEQHRNAYLAIQGTDIFKLKGNQCKITILDPKQMIYLLGQKRATEAAESMTQVSAVSSATQKQAVVLRRKPECTICFDHVVEVMFLPCKHALCCHQCKEKWVLSNRFPFATGRSGVDCPLCRTNVESFGCVYFMVQSCKLCGCDELNAVSAGQNGCGCVVGCYEKARMLKPGDACPSCGVPIVEITRIYTE